MATSKIEVLGLGSPIADQTIRVSSEFLQSITEDVGGSQVVDYATFMEMLEKSGSHAVSSPGGSAANTVVALQKLGTKTGLMGMIGQDQKGIEYKRRLEQLGIKPLLTEDSIQSTAQVLCMVTPDGQRTMRCFLGASVGYNSSHLKEEYFDGVKLLHCEGYTLYNGDGELVYKAMKMAKRAGAKVSLDLASFEVVRRYHQFILGLLENYVDIVFCNEDEAKVLNPHGSVEETASLLASYCQIAVITLGSKGCLVANGNQRFYSRTTPINCIDTTGAGDIFASGFLHSYLKGYTLQECCKVAHILGGTVLRVIGAQLSDEVWEEVHKDINPIFEKKRTQMETITNSFLFSS